MASDQRTKAYLGAEGNIKFTDLLAEILLGASARSSRIVGLQTPGGSGALRLGAELLARARSGARIWLGTPSWANHGGIFAYAGLTVVPHPFYDRQQNTITFDAMLEALEDARSGDAILLHGCCHNPTGADFDQGQWRTIAALCAERGLIPFLDLAYHGLGDGLEADAYGVRTMLAAVPDAIVAYSCDKNFGLYRERTGAIWVLASNRPVAAKVRETLFAFSRSLWSMPPDHGAEAVRIVLEDAAKRHDWQSELTQMRERLKAMRQALAATHARLAHLAMGKGLFATLAIPEAAIGSLLRDHAIYTAPGGRINVAGLTLENIAPVAKALVHYLNDGLSHGRPTHPSVPALG